MLAPAGLSGAPLITQRDYLGNPSQVVGVVYSSTESYSVVQEAEVDAETGETTAEVRRLVPFGLAHYTTSLLELAGAATEERPLSEIVT
jgi:hypothetical protein